MPVILIAFIVMMSFAAFMPSNRDGQNDERGMAGAAAAGGLVTWHAAAVRACYAAPGGACGAGRVPDASVLPQLPTMVSAAGNYRQNRFVSYADGTYVFSLYTGNDSIRPREAIADASTSLLRSANPDSMASIGFWNADAGRFVSGTYSVKVMSGGVIADTRNQDGIPTRPDLYAPGLASAAPMVATKVRFP